METESIGTTAALFVTATLNVYCAVCEDLVHLKGEANDRKRAGLFMIVTSRVMLLPKWPLSLQLVCMTCLE